MPELQSESAGDQSSESSHGSDGLLESVEEIQRRYSSRVSTPDGSDFSGRDGSEVGHFQPGSPPCSEGSLPDLELCTVEVNEVDANSKTSCPAGEVEAIQETTDHDEIWNECGFCRETFLADDRELEVNEKRHFHGKVDMYKFCSNACEHSALYMQVRAVTVQSTQPEEAATLSPSLDWQKFVEEFAGDSASPSEFKLWRERKEREASTRGMTQSSSSVETGWEVTFETDRSNLGGPGDRPASDFDEELSSTGQSFTQLSLGSRPGLHTRGPIPSSNKPMRPKDGLTALPRLSRLAPMFTLFGQVKGFQFNLSISAQPSWSVPITLAIAVLSIAVVTIYISKKDKEVKRSPVKEFELDFCFTCE